MIVWDFNRHTPNRNGAHVTHVGADSASAPLHHLHRHTHPRLLNGQRHRDRHIIMLLAPRPVELQSRQLPSQRLRMPALTGHRKPPMLHQHLQRRQQHRPRHGLITPVQMCRRPRPTRDQHRIHPAVELPPQHIHHWWTHAGAIHHHRPPHCDQRHHRDLLHPTHNIRIWSVQPKTLQHAHPETPQAVQAGLQELVRRRLFPNALHRRNRRGASANCSKLASAFLVRRRSHVDETVRGRSDRIPRISPPS